MSTILNIETATEVCSVSLSRGGSTIDVLEEQESYKHASRLTPLIQDLLAKNQTAFDTLEAVAVSAGPGSYTGLRIGAAVAKGLCYALDIPLIGVSTLHALAAGIYDRVNNSDALYCSTIDARRSEVYTAVYDGSLTEVMPVQPLILEEDSFGDLLDRREVYFGGNGSKKVQKTLLHHPRARFLSDVQCSANSMAKFSDAAIRAKKFESLVYFEPFYLKDFKGNVKKIEKK